MHLSNSIKSVGNTKITRMKEIVAPRPTKIPNLLNTRLVETIPRMVPAVVRIEADVKMEIVQSLTVSQAACFLEDCFRFPRYLSVNRIA